MRLNGLSLRSSPVYGGTYEVVPIGTDPNTADIRPLSPLNYELGPNGPKMVVKIPDVGKDAQVSASATVRFVTLIPCS